MQKTFTPLVLLVSFGLAAGALFMAPALCLGDDDIEEVENVEVVSPEVVGGTQDTFTIEKVIGRNHPALVHLPIGMLVALFLVELIALIRPRMDMGRAGLVLSVFTALSFIPAAISGFLRAQEVFSDQSPSPLLLEHRNLMISAFVVIAAAAVIRFVKREGLEGTLRYGYLAAVFVALLLTGLGGHHGGQLVYGDSYLPY